MFYFFENFYSQKQMMFTKEMLKPIKSQARIIPPVLFKLVSSEGW